MPSTEAPGGTRPTFDHVIVVGGGASGLGAALALARTGHCVTVIERDHTPMPETADEAFDWDRRGAPQVRHSHAFLARLRNLLLHNHPDVYRTLLAEGATELPFGRDLPPEVTNYEPIDSDADLVMLACRRTTFEWVIRRAALAEGGVELRTGVAVDGLLTAGNDGSPPTVTGVRLSDGTELAADLVVVAAGRRSGLSDWLVGIGAAAAPDDMDDTGIVYFSRFYRLREDAEYPPRSGAIGGDLGYLKYGVFVGDNRTFSVTLASPTDDAELRRVLADPAVFDHAASQLVATAPWLDGRAEPITPTVHVMAGLVNRWRQYVVDGEPLALGLIAIGDATICTNPLYGRGCSTGFWSAHLLVEEIEAGPADLRELARGYDRRLREQILPWYRASVEQDREARRVSAALLAGEDPDADKDDPRTMMRAVLRDGLVPAIRSDAIVLRSFLRSFNLLDPPDAMTTDPDVGARIFTVWQDRDNRPPEAPMGPKLRKDFVGLLSA